MFVEDPQRSKEFYERVFEASPVYEDANATAFEFENTIVNFLRTSEAHDLIGPAAVGTAEAGSRFQLTIWVEDADAVCEQLESRGVELVNGPLDRTWGLRTAAFADPDGHIWEVAAQIEAA
jgi:catechol 2,3-dioxygenase-like lactoylglutathione lyase family enzyme